MFIVHLASSMLLFAFNYFSGNMKLPVRLNKTSSLCFMSKIITSGACEHWIFAKNGYFNFGARLKRPNNLIFKGKSQVIKLKRKTNILEFNS